MLIMPSVSCGRREKEKVMWNNLLPSPLGLHLWALLFTYRLKDLTSPASESFLKHHVRYSAFYPWDVCWSCLEYKHSQLGFKTARFMDFRRCCPTTCSVLSQDRVHKDAFKQKKAFLLMLGRKWVIPYGSDDSLVIKEKLLNNCWHGERFPFPELLLECCSHSRACFEARDPCMWFTWAWGAVPPPLLGTHRVRKSLWPLHQSEFIIVHGWGSAWHLPLV